MASPALQGALKDGFREVVMVYDMPEICKFPFLDSFQKRLLWTHNEVDLAPHPVIGLVLQEEDAEKFLSALGFESLDRFRRVSKRDPYLTAIEEDGGDKRLCQA